MYIRAVFIPSDDPSSTLLAVEKALIAAMGRCRLTIPVPVREQSLRRIRPFADQHNKTKLRT